MQTRNNKRARETEKRESRCGKFKSMFDAEENIK